MLLFNNVSVHHQKFRRQPEYSFPKGHFAKNQKKKKENCIGQPLIYGLIRLESIERMMKKDCYYALRENIKKNVVWNVHTSLHYAIFMQKTNAALQLIEQGAYQGISQCYGLKRENRRKSSRGLS